MTPFLDVDLIRWHMALENHGAPGVAVLCALVYHAGVNRYGRPWPGLERIARDSGTSVEEARRVCWGLMECGLLYDEWTDPELPEPGWFRFESGTLADALMDGYESHSPIDYSWRTRAYPEGLIEGVDPE